MAWPSMSAINLFNRSSPRKSSRRIDDEIDLKSYALDLLLVPHKENVLRTLDLLLGNIEDDSNDNFNYDTGVLDQIDSSILQFSFEASTIARKILEGNRKFGEKNQLALRSVGHTPGKEGIDEGPSILTLILSLIPKIQWDSSSMILRRYSTRQSLKRIKSKVSELRTLSKDVFKDCDRLMRKKNRIFEEFGFSKVDTVSDVQRKQSHQEEKHGVSITLTKLVGEYGIRIADKPWTSFETHVQIIILQSILRITEALLEKSIQSLMEVQRILWSVDFSKLKKIRVLKLRTTVDAHVLEGSTKYLETGLQDIHELAANSKLKFAEMYTLKTHLKTLKSNLKYTDPLSEGPQFIEYSFDDPDFGKYIWDHIVEKLEL